MRVEIWSHGTIGATCGDKTRNIAKKRIRTVQSSLALRKPNTHGHLTIDVTECPKCGMVVRVHKPGDSVELMAKASKRRLMY